MEPNFKLDRITELRLRLATSNRALDVARRHVRTLASAVIAAGAIGFMGGLMSAVVIIKLSL